MVLVEGGKRNKAEEKTRFYLVVSKALCLAKAAASTIEKAAAAVEMMMYSSTNKVGKVMLLRRRHCLKHSKMEKSYV